MGNDIPKYNDSYTDNENEIIHSFLESASVDELIEYIKELINSYSDTEKKKINKELEQLLSEIHNRVMMKQKYRELLKCKEDWGKYCDDLYAFKDCLNVREKYEKYKKKHKSSKKYDGQSLIQMFMEYYYDDTLIKKSSEEFIRRCTLSPNAKRGIKKPQEPSTEYSNIDEVPYTDTNEIEDFRQLGKSNLKFLLIMLLQLVGSPDEDRASVIIKFQTRKFAGNNHKKESTFFSMQDLSYLEYEKKCMSLLDDIKEYKKEAIIISKNLKE